MAAVKVSLGQRQVAASLRAGLTDPAAIIAITGEPGLGKSFVVEAVIRELGLTAWVISPAIEEMSDRLALLYKAKSLANYVLVIEDAQALSVPKLMGLFALLRRDRAAFPRLVFVARPSFWRLFDDPALAGARDLIGTVAVLFAVDEHDSAHLRRHRLGVATVTSRPRWSSRILSGSAALLVLALAVALLAATMTDRPPTASAVRATPAPMSPASP